jgi:uncharacterized protein (DUF488 family)
MSEDSPSPPAIYTIGYGARDMAAFLDALRARGIQYLVDVRSTPYSKFKPEFSKDALDAHLRGAGVRYVYLGDALGGQPKDPGCYGADGKVLYDALKVQPGFREGLARLAKAHRQGLRVVVMCSEGKPEMCHRSKLIGVALEEMAIPVQHIDEGGNLRTQAEVLDAVTGGQPSLFGDPELTSRKRYRAPASAEGDAPDDDA